MSLTLLHTHRNDIKCNLSSEKKQVRVVHVVTLRTTFTNVYVLVFIHVFISICISVQLLTPIKLHQMTVQTYRYCGCGSEMGLFTFCKHRHRRCGSFLHVAQSVVSVSVGWACGKLCKRLNPWRCRLGDIRVRRTKEPCII